MIALGWVLVIGSGVLGLLLLVWVVAEEMTVRRRRSLGYQARLADQKVQIAHREARRAMNDAAGQSWRNLAG